MSFILDSIKKAERERNLGQQFPSLSIDDKAAYFDHVGNSWKHWWLLSLGIIVTAFIVWIATYYYINKDQQNEQQLSEVYNSNKEITNANNSKAVNADVLRPNFELVSAKNIHKSQLKAVKIINEEDDYLEIEVNNIDDSKQSILAERVEPEIKKQVDTSLETPQISKPPYEIKQAVENEISDVTKKQQLVSIYTDLAEVDNSQHDEEFLDRQNVLHEDFDDTLLEVKNASYVDSKISRTEETILQSKTEVHVRHETAISTGVPSFGELPYDIQEQIPDFNVSVHMFHEDPKHRRIRINGGMYTEGKYLQQDFALVEITRYGAVFDYQGHLFRLNVR